MAALTRFHAHVRDKSKTYVQGQSEAAFSKAPQTQTYTLAGTSSTLPPACQHIYAPPTDKKHQE